MIQMLSHLLQKVTVKNSVEFFTVFFYFSSISSITSPTAFAIEAKPKSVG